MRDATRPRRPDSRRRAWWKPALAAASLVIVVQGVLLIDLWPKPGLIAPMGSKAAGVVLQIQFAPTAEEAQIREALQAVNGVLIGGPGALGVYRVRLNGLGEDQSLGVAEAVARLQTFEEVVVHVARD